MTKIKCLRNNSKDLNSYPNLLLRLYGLHQGPYSTKDCSVFLKGHYIFGKSQNCWNNFCSNFSIFLR